MCYTNNQYSRRELERRIGNVAQLGGTRHYELREGKSKGVHAVDCRTGTGFDFTVLPGRGMDISLASYQGKNLVYLTANGEVHSAFYNPMESEWLNGFFGGLLTTCGLTYFGPPGTDGGEQLGLHGRVSNTPAIRMNDLSGWVEDQYIIKLQGIVEESQLFGDKLRLERTITSKIGSKSLKICDKVSNFGFKESPFCILYHINPGFPLLDEGTELIVSSRKMLPYDEYSAENCDDAYRLTAPQANFKEENFLHLMAADKDGYGYAAMINRELEDGIGLYLKFKADALPYFSEWKMMGEGDYVVGIEPSNVKLENRGILRRSGTLPMLAPGESKVMEIEIGILDGCEKIESFQKMVN
jgi:hypothetical protein